MLVCINRVCVLSELALYISHCTCYKLAVVSWSMYEWVLYTLYLKHKSLYSQVLALRSECCRPFTNSTHKSAHSALSQDHKQMYGNNGNNCHLKVDVYNYLLPVFPLRSSQPSPGSVAVPPLWSECYSGHTLYTEGR